MEVRRQRCRACGSYDAHNLLVREPQHPLSVYVRCANCRQLVARYRLSEYYQPGDGIESYLESLGTSADDSGRDYLAELAHLEQDSQEGYRQALEQLPEESENVPPQSL
jgi:hypothetical protein